VTEEKSMNKIKEIWGVVKSTILNAWDEFHAELGLILGTLQVAIYLFSGEGVIVLLGGLVLVLMTWNKVWNKYLDN